MQNMTDPWLQGVRARVAGASRAACPYGQDRIEIGNNQIMKANEWFGGWDTADIIFAFHQAREVA